MNRPFALVLALSTGACGLTVAAKNQCTTSSDCITGHVCSNEKVCVSPSIAGGSDGGSEAPEPAVACDTPSGAVHMLASAEDTVNRIAGKWKFCGNLGDPPTIGIASEIDAIEFTSDEHYFILVPDENGNLGRHLASFGGEEGGTMKVHFGDAVTWLEMQDFRVATVTQSLSIVVSDPPRKILLDDSTFAHLP